MTEGWWLPLCLTAVVVADQVVKAVVISRLGPLDRPRGLELGPALRIRPVSASRTLAGAFGLGPAMLATLWAGCLAVLVLAAWAGASASAVALAAWGAALGGALSNLIDVARRGRVVDYVDVPWWPAFNLADAAIVAGVILALAS
jgi:signal peptidase II